MSGDEPIRITLTQLSDYSFNIGFDQAAIPDLVTDEPAPLGHGQGPDPVRMLLAAVANCLSASLLFAMRKYRNAPGAIRAEVRGALGRNAAGRLRVQRIEVDLHLPDDTQGYVQFERLLRQFEDFCVVTESVRGGIEIAVQVHDGSGQVRHASVNTAGVNAAGG